MTKTKTVIMMIKNHILMKFLNHKYHYNCDEYDDIVQNNNLDIRLLKTLFYRGMKKLHEIELDRCEIDDYEGICKCNIIYSPTEIEKQWERIKSKRERKMFEYYDEFINNQFYCHMFNTHLCILGVGEYNYIKADEYNYSVNKYIERQIMRYKNYDIDTEDEDIDVEHGEDNLDEEDEDSDDEDSDDDD